MTVLVFPSCLDGNDAFIEEARRHGRRLIGASSLDSDPQAGRFDAWDRLPWLHESTFGGALRELLVRHQVEHVYTAHQPTWHALASDPRLMGGAASLVGIAPIERESARVREAWTAARKAMMEIDRFAGRSSGYSLAFVASLLAQVRGMFGECQQEKIVALCGAMADAPAGDVIEIGSFFGKSAWALDRLAAARAIGPVIVVDPWCSDAALQRESTQEIQVLAGVWDWDTVFAGFLLATAACGAGSRFNYLRLTGDLAARHYHAGEPVRSAEFGETRIGGRIALLHIDGNHDEACVRSDYRVWSPALADGGWLVFDDYQWAHGDGPRKVADETVAALGPRVLRRFVAGSALFAKVGAA